MNSFTLNGIVTKGHQIASGLSPTGKDGLNATVVKQMPFFIKAGVKDADRLFTGTLNINISPHSFSIKKPDYVVTCEWHPGINETFWLVSMQIDVGGKIHAGYVYFPLPSKIQSRNVEVIEILTEKIDGVKYGDDVTLYLSENKIKLVTPEEARKEFK